MNDVQQTILGQTEIAGQRCQRVSRDHPANFPWKRSFWVRVADVGQRYWGGVPVCWL